MAEDGGERADAGTEGLLQACPADVQRLAAVLGEVERTGRPAPADGPEVAALLAAVAARWDGQPWEPVARFVVGHLYLARGLGAADDGQLRAGIEHLRPVAEAAPDSMDPRVTAVLAGTAAVVDGRIERPAETANRRLATLLTRADAGDPRALAEAAGPAADLERLTGPAEEEHVDHLSNACVYWCRVVTTSGDHAAADRAVALGRAALDAAGDAAAETRALGTVNLAIALYNRAALHRTAPAMRAAVPVLREANRLLPPDDPMLPTVRAYLGVVLVELGQWGEDPDLLAEAETVLRQAAARDPALNSLLLTALNVRYAITSDVAPLRESVALARAVVRPDLGDTHRLVDGLKDLTARTGDPAPLDEAVERGRAALAGPGDDPGGWRPALLNSLAMALHLRYQRTGTVADLDEAIALLSTALDQTAPDERFRPRYVGRLGWFLTARATRSGDGPTLVRAIELLNQAIADTPPGDGYLARHHINLAVAWAEAHARGEPHALDRSVAAHREALDRLPAGHPKRGVYAASLAGALLKRGAGNDPSEAVGLLREALAALPDDHPDRAVAEASLASALAREASDSPPPDTPPPDTPPPSAPLSDAPPSDAPPGVAAVAVPAEAVALARRAAGRDSPYRLRARLTLAGVLTRSADASHVAEGRALWAALARDADVSPPLRVEAATGWGRTAAEAGAWDDATTALGTAIDLLLQHGDRRLSRVDRAVVLGRYGFSLAADAAAAALRTGRPELALELLEAGRGVLTGHHLDLRDDAGDLARHAPDLVAGVERLHAELDAAEAAGGATGGWSPDAPGDRLRDWNRRWAALLAEARGRPGLADYLRPVPAAELAATAGTGGPVVVVSTSRYGCDALLVTAAGITHLPLPELTWTELFDRTARFVGDVDQLGRPSRLGEVVRREERVADTLGWLWNTVTGPVLDALGLTGTPPEGSGWPRVWWSPTGPLTFLPLHAAGHHRSGGPAVLDRVVSSYTPTLRLLAALRRRRAAPTLAGGLVVAPSTGPAGLPGAEREAALIRDRIPGTTVLLGPDATRDAVLAALPEHPWVHLACHGTADIGRPERSRLVLHDGPVPLGDLWRLRPTDPQLAFLAACDSGQGSIRASEEALNLAAAMQAVGYRHAVGSLWRVSDELSAQLADDTYGWLADHGGDAPFDQVPVALHHAVRRLRDGNRARPSLWAAHLHSGP